MILLDEQVMEDKIYDLVAKKFRVKKAELTKTTFFVRDLRADSLDMLELMLVISESFNVRINPCEIPSLHTLGQLIEMIAQLQKKIS